MTAVALRLNASQHQAAHAFMNACATERDAPSPAGEGADALITLITRFHHSTTHESTRRIAFDD